MPTGGEADLAGCAAGDFDEQWRNFGNLMVQHGRGDSVVRLGWEFNERTMPWRGIDTQAYIGCYRNAADNIRAANPDVILDWTINAHGSPDGLCGGLSTNCYPGDDYVDIIGIDNYDHYPWSPTKADFDRTAAAPEGLTWLYAFAQQHKKPFSVGEWGVVPTGDAGKENPEFIRWMHEWFAAHARRTWPTRRTSPTAARAASSPACSAGTPGASRTRSRPRSIERYSEVDLRKTGALSVLTRYV